MNRNKATQRKTAPMKKAVQRQNYSSKKTQGQRLGGVGQQLSPNYGSTITLENRKPIQRTLKNGNVLVTHREFISKINGSTSFSLNSNAINPGLPAQFNWLFAIANQYESYRFKKLKYIFVNSKTGTFSGEVIMGIDYDASDASPFNEQELQNYWGCKTGVITRPLELIAEVSAMHKISNKFVRLGSLSSNQDIKLYDSGNFFLATSDCADTSTIGRLFVEYEVELMTPQVNGGNVLSSKTSFVDESNTAPLGTAIETTTGSLGITWLSGTTFSINVPGQYEVTLTFAGTGITAVPTISAASPSLATPPITGIISGTSALSVNFLKVNSASDIFTVSLGTTTTITATLLRLAPYTYANA